MEQPILRLQKNAEATTNKMRIPQQIIDKWGNQFYMEIYKDYIKLIPIKDKEVKYLKIKLLLLSILIVFPTRTLQIQKILIKNFTLLQRMFCLIHMR